MMELDTDDTTFTLPTAPSGSWEDLTPNERAWVEFIRIISCGSDPRVTPARMRALSEALDVGREGAGRGGGWGALGGRVSLFRETGKMRAR